MSRSRASRGGDRRGQQSASLLIVEKDAGYAGRVWTPSSRFAGRRPRAADRGAAAASSHTAPGAVREQHRTGIGSTLDETLADELRARLAGLGHDGDLAKAFTDWAGAANLEERVDGVGQPSTRSCSTHCAGRAHEGSNLLRGHRSSSCSPSIISQVRSSSPSCLTASPILAIAAACVALSTLPAIEDSQWRREYHSAGHRPAIRGWH